MRDERLGCGSRIQAPLTTDYIGEVTVKKGYLLMLRQPVQVAYGEVYNERGTFGCWDPLMLTKPTPLMKGISNQRHL
jgi:hypothetical protein